MYINMEIEISVWGTAVSSISSTCILKTTKLSVHVTCTLCLFVYLVVCHRNHLIFYDGAYFVYDFVSKIDFADCSQKYHYFCVVILGWGSIPL